MNKRYGNKIMMGLAVLVLIGLVGFVIYRFNFVENDAQNDTISASVSKIASVFFIWYSFLYNETDPVSLNSEAGGSCRVSF